VVAFLISAYIEQQLAAGVRMNIGWQIAAYTVLTLGEVLVYGTGLEFFYTQAPNHLKSFVMGLFLLAVSIGNIFTAAVNIWLELPDGTSRLGGTAYYLFFAGLMLASSIGYVFYAGRYRERRFVQGVDSPVEVVAA
jgi:POT family proton-dependent oligopeptide transporter